MKFGYFDNANLEYVIEKPNTPTPWMNYIGNGGFSGIVSNTGGGLSFDGDPSNRRVTRYKFNNQPIDRPGRYLYIRNQDTGEYWSPTWQPVLKDLSFYECRHGLGYTQITGVYDDVETKITYYVPVGASYEIWNVELKNLSKTPKNLKLFSYVEFSWNDAKFDMLSHWPSMAFVSDFENGKIVVDTVAQQLTGTPMYSYISTDFKIDGYDCSQRDFIGDYRSEQNPIVLETGICTNSNMYSDNCVGVLSSSIVLAPGETVTGHYTVGATKAKEVIDTQISAAFDKKNLEAGLSGIHELWQGYRDMLQVETPDNDVNTMLNIWHTYQSKTTFDWSRFISIYERGVSRGLGFRDSMQDVLGVMHAVPQKAKERIKLLLSIQLSAGDAKAVYYPATKEATGGGRSDDHLWSSFTVCNYVKETGDFGFLDEVVSYYDGGEATVLEHLEKGLEFTMKHLGAHGIPDMLGSDWNDSLAPMNKGGKGGAESTFVFFQLAHAAYELIQLYTFLKLDSRLAFVNEVYDYCRSMLDTIWDGEWFIRAFTPEGEKYGTNEDEWNKIYLNPQSWSVLSRLPEKEKLNLAFDNVMKYLLTDTGIITHYPASSGFDPATKNYYLFTAGARENGGIFFHSNTWAIIALTMLGRNKDAFKSYRASLPIRRNEKAEICLTEPYVYSQTMLAPPHNRPGACVNSWLTGTASWMYLSATQYILGIRPEFAGLAIDPCVPDEWNEFSVVRKCRGVKCKIKVTKNDGEKGLFVGEKKFDGNTVPWDLFQNTDSLEIELKM